jgi:hypothetical protein
MIRTGSGRLLFEPRLRAAVVRCCERSGYLQITSRIGPHGHVRSCDYPVGCCPHAPSLSRVKPGKLPRAVRAGCGTERKNMASVSDGTYRISINGQQFLTALNERMVVLLPDDSRQLWQVRRTDNGGYTIRQDTTGLYLSYEGEPDTFESVQLLPDRREWNITDGPDEGTVTIAAPGGDEPLTLGLSPTLIFPPMVALSPAQRQTEAGPSNPPDHCTRPVGRRLVCAEPCGFGIVNPVMIVSRLMTTSRYVSAFVEAKAVPKRTPAGQFAVPIVHGAVLFFRLPMPREPSGRVWMPGVASGSAVMVAPGGSGRSSRKSAAGAKNSVPVTGVEKSRIRS